MAGASALCCSGPLGHESRPGRVRAVRHVVYANPIPGSQALVERDGRVLLGRRAHDPAAGLWDLPGGFVDEYEHPLDALRRELREETGLEIEPHGVPRHLDAAVRRPERAVCLTWLARPSRAARSAPATISSSCAGSAPDELPGARRAGVRELRRDPLTLARAAAARVARPARSGTEAAFRAPSARRRLRP